MAVEDGWIITHHQQENLANINVQNICSYIIQQHIDS